MFNGMGRLEKENGEIYIGLFKDGKFNGKVRMLLFFNYYIFYSNPIKLIAWKLYPLDVVTL